MAQLAHELVDEAAARTPVATALRHGAERISYSALAGGVATVASALRACGAGLEERVAVRLPGCPAFVTALLGAGAAGCAVVPIDPGLAPERCAALLRDCGAGILITDAAGLDSLHALLPGCPILRTVVVHGGPAPAHMQLRTLGWDAFLALSGGVDGMPAAASLAALLYCVDDCVDDRVDAGGAPRGIALSHHNLVAGAQSTARCAGIGTGDRVLSALPLHSDYGFNALLATFAAGATAVLHLAIAAAHSPVPASAVPGSPVQDANCASGAADALARLLALEEMSGLFVSAATLKELAGRDLGHAAGSLRYLVCAGGGLDRVALDRVALDTLRTALPRTRIHLLYDIGDACRSTSLMPAMLAERPGSIGRALPYSEWRVLRPDGRECAAGETGELVHCGALVTLGYWNDPQRNTEHFRELPARPGLSRRDAGYFPGIFARKDGDGFLYLADTRSDIIITQGYRVSPREVEKIVVGTGLVAEAAAVGVAHPVLGQVIAVLATPRPGARLNSSILFGACQARLPQYMLPAMVDVRRAPLPRARDGQIDRALLAGELAPLFAEVTP